MSNETVKTITITRPDDWHIHLRDEEILSGNDGLDGVAVATAKVFGRALVMPNLVPPVTTVEMTEAYRNKILAATSEYKNFKPYMALYLTDNTTVEDIQKSAASDYVLSAKLYPAGATTNSDFGVTDIKKIYHVLEEMQKLKMTLCLHGEITNGWIFDREKGFIHEVLKPLRKEFPYLSIVLEHITTKEAVEYVLNSKSKIGATITIQHLIYNGNDMLVGGIKPHLYCLPILKKDTEQIALVKAATSGNKKFFLGTDSAPHIKNRKISSCGCAGCFTAPIAIPLYTELFDKANALDKLEAFASHNGAIFYGLPINSDTITLVKKSMLVPDEYRFSSDDENVIIPLKAGEEIQWSILES